MWREWFPHAWMHTDGKINAILEDLIEIGVDVVQLEQPRLLGIEEIGGQFSGRICFQSQCDIQLTLPLGDLDAIRTEARLLLQRWSTPQGGFVVMDYDDEHIGVPVAKRQTMLRTFVEADPWRKRIEPL